MRSRRYMLCTNRFLPLVLLASVGLSGCQVGRTFFQMNSDAPVPFFGVDLLPKREKASPTAGVSRFQNEAVSNASASSESPKVRDKTPGRLTRLLTRTPPPERLALPLSTVADSETASTDAPVEDFR